MKNLLILIFALTTSFLYSQSVLEQTDNLIENGKYKSAYELLEQEDPNNQDPDLVLKKVEIAQDYFVQSMGHQMFAFSNVNNLEEVYEMRRNATGETFTMYMLPVNEVLDTLILQHPTRYDLHRALAGFYFDVTLKYGGNWVMSEAKALDKMFTHSKIAIEHNAGDYMTQYQCGYYQTLQEDYRGAIPYYLASIAQEPNYPTAHYNLAICYFYQGQSMAGIPYAERSYQLYQEPSMKGDAARITANLYKDTQDFENALKYYEFSIEAQPDNYHNLNQLLEIQLRLNKTEEARTTAAAFFALAPNNPRIASDLTDIYAVTEQDAELIQLFTTLEADYSSDREAIGNLHFYLAQFYFSRDQPKKGKEILLIAQKDFESIFEPNHEVFGLIKELMEGH